MGRPEIRRAICAREAGFPEDDGAPEYHRSCVRETQFTLVRGCRTFVALDSEGVVLMHGVLEPGGDKEGLVHDLYGRLRLEDPTVLDCPTLNPTWKSIMARNRLRHQCPQR